MQFQLDGLILILLMGEFLKPYMDIKLKRVIWKYAKQQSFIDFLRNILGNI